MTYGRGTLRRGEFVYSPYTADNLELVVPKNQLARAQFEDMYGCPTNVDTVWIDREINQDEANKLRRVTYLMAKACK